MPDRTGRQYCGQCQAHYEYAWPEGSTAEETVTLLIEAQDAAAEAHRQWHQDHPGTIHVRQQVNPRRVRGNGFYKVTLGASEDGSRVLCGDEAGGSDITWAEARYPKALARVTCEDCKRIRQGQ